MQDSSYLNEHFKSWLVTDKCKETFNHILEKVVSFRVLVEEEEIMDFTWGEGSLVIELQSVDEYGDPKTVLALFAPSDNSRAKDIIESLHSEILIVNSEDDEERLYYPSIMYEHFIEDEEEDNIDRFIAFSDLGQNCTVLDMECLNSLKDPKICLFSHGSDLEDSEEYSGQEENSYNHGGFILRVLANFLYSEEDSDREKLYSEFCCG